MATFASVIDQVESLYVGYFGRAGDPSGTQSWTQAVSTGKVTISSVAALCDLARSSGQVSVSCGPAGGGSDTVCRPSLSEPVQSNPGPGGPSPSGLTT